MAQTETKQAAPERLEHEFVPVGFAVDALDKAIRSISSLTLEPLEPEKQKL